MRGTLHFVAAEDVRWMLELLTPRVVAASAGRAPAGLRPGRDGLRPERRDRHPGAGRRSAPDPRRNVPGAGARRASPPPAGRGLHITWRMAHDGLICFGPREGKQQTFVLLDEWIPGAKRMARDEALAELARRYFTSHGPATVHDFAWWSGLLLSDAAQGLAMASGALVSVRPGGSEVLERSVRYDRPLALTCLSAASLRRIHRRVPRPQPRSLEPAHTRHADRHGHPAAGDRGERTRGRNLGEDAGQELGRGGRESVHPSWGDRATRGGGGGPAVRRIPGAERRAF